MNKVLTYIASGVIVGLFILTLVIQFIAPDGIYNFRKSPKTGICYEVHTEFFIVPVMSESPVDSEYCDK